MITIDFESKGNLGLTEHIYNCIKQQILEGTLKAKEKLPSKRALAEHLKVSVITTQNAYAQLISEGYIYSIEKKGFFVTDLSVEGSAVQKKELQAGKKSSYHGDSPLYADGDSPQLWGHPTDRGDSPQQQGQPSQTGTALNNRDTSSTPQQPLFCDLTSNATASDKFPFTLWAHTMRQVLNSGDQRLLEKQNVKGVLELRKSIALYLKNFRGMEVDPEQIVIGAGTESLYSMLVQFLGRERTFAIENPGYHKVSAIINLCGAKCIPLEMDEQGISMDLLQKSQASVVHVSPNHHFPTGTVMPVRRRRELLAWSHQAADRTGRHEPRIIIEDEYDSEFRFTGKPIPTLQSQDQWGSVIYINTFSKTLSPSFRISYMVLPKTLVHLFQERLGFYTCPVSAFEQYTLARFIQEGNYEKHIIRMKNYYRNLRNEFILEIQKSSLKEHASIREQESGLHFILHIESHLSEEEIKMRLRNQGIKVLSLKDFFYSTCEKSAGNEGTNLVINYSGIRKQSIPELVSRMKKAIIG